MNPRTLLVPIALIFAGLACPPRATAHRIDEYLQATLLSVEHDRVELAIDLTAGTNVASRVLALIDTDRDGEISPAEGAAYAQSVLGSIVISIDGRAVPVRLLDSHFAEFRDMTSGIGTTRLRATATFPPAIAGRHQVYYRNTHQSEIGAYLVNALVPTDKEIQINEQRRDYLQREVTIEFRVGSATAWSPIWWLLAGLAMACVLAASHSAAFIAMFSSLTRHQHLRVWRDQSRL
jgi:hypothetical protein